MKECAMTTSDSSPRSTETPLAGLKLHAAFEAAWPEIKALRNRAAFLTASITTVLTACVIWLTIETKEAFFLPALFFPAFAVFWGNRYVQQEVFEKLTPSLAAAVGSEHGADDSSADEVGLPKGLLPHFNRMETKNAFTGVLDQSPFLSVEVTVQDKLENAVEGSSRVTRATTYFVGLCVVVTNLPRADPLVVTKEAKGLFGTGPLLSDTALKRQMNELTEHKLKKVEPNATHASDLNLYIPKTSEGLSPEAQDFLRRLTRVERLLAKKDRLYSAVRTDHEAAIAIMTRRSLSSLGGLLTTRQKLLTQMDRALQGLAWTIRLVEAIIESD